MTKEFLEEFYEAYKKFHKEVMEAVNNSFGNHSRDPKDIDNKLCTLRKEIFAADNEFTKFLLNYSKKYTES